MRKFALILAMALLGACGSEADYEGLAETVDMSDDGGTVRSRVHAGVRVELTWDHPTSDLDLHWVRSLGSQGTYRSYDDCYYVTPEPNWYPDFPDMNPVLDTDDQEGYGPENISTVDPRRDTYRIFVHNLDGDEGPSPATVRIYINGFPVPVSTFNNELPTTDSVWVVADFTMGYEGPSVSSINVLGTQVSVIGGYTVDTEEPLP